MNNYSLLISFQKQLTTFFLAISSALFFSRHLAALFCPCSNNLQQHCSTAAAKCFSKSVAKLLSELRIPGVGLLKWPALQSSAVKKKKKKKKKKNNSKAFYYAKG